MNAYYGSEELRNEILFEISEHQRLDNYTQRLYWNGKKGCLIGCLAKENDDDQHKYLEDVYNIPKEILYLADSIFEGITVEQSKKWPMQFCSAIKTGQDLSRVRSKFAHWTLMHKGFGVITLVDDADLKVNIETIATSILLGIENNLEALEVAEVAEVAWVTMALRTEGINVAAEKQADKLIEIIKEEAL